MRVAPSRGLERPAARGPLSPVFEGPAANSPPASFRDDVLAGLGATPKTLPCKYLYDELGSHLFEQICELPEYDLTRTELAIMARHAAELAARIGPAALVVELGSGSSRKTRLLLDALCRPAAYVPIDIAPASLVHSVAALRERYPGLAVLPVHADFTRRFALPPGAANHAARRVVYFPGSTIGNFDAAPARRLLGAIRRFVGPNGAVVLGVDLVKPARELELAYDDPTGVTSAFNKNLLSRINRELGADFEPASFRHVARFDSAALRIEMSLQSLRPHAVSVADVEVAFGAAESIVTEHSHKYTLASLAALAAAAGLRTEASFCDDSRRFCVALLVPT